MGILSRYSLLIAGGGLLAAGVWSLLARQAQAAGVAALAAGAAVLLGTLASRESRPLPATWAHLERALRRGPGLLFLFSDY